MQALDLSAASLAQFRHHTWRFRDSDYSIPIYPSALISPDCLPNLATGKLSGDLSHPIRPRNPPGPLPRLKYDLETENRPPPQLVADDFLLQCSVSGLRTLVLLARNAACASTISIVAFSQPSVQDAESHYQNVRQQPEKLLHSLENRLSMHRCGLGKCLGGRRRS